MQCYFDREEVLAWRNKNLLEIVRLLVRVDAGWVAAVVSTWRVSSLDLLSASLGTIWDHEHLLLQLSRQVWPIQEVSISFSNASQLSLIVVLEQDLVMRSRLVSSTLRNGFSLGTGL